MKGLYPWLISTEVHRRKRITSHGISRKAKAPFRSRRIARRGRIVDAKQEFQLERAYAKLPKEFMGVKRQPLSPVGGNRNGVVRTADYFSAAVGSPDGILTAQQWLRLPSHALGEATNGEVWFDGFGELTLIRDRLNAMPEDIRLKRLAGNLLLMAQSGQYNFTRKYIIPLRVSNCSRTSW